MLGPVRWVANSRQKLVAMEMDYLYTNRLQARKQ
jgi:hypothetical protein